MCNAKTLFYLHSMQIKTTQKLKAEMLTHQCRALHGQAQRAPLRANSYIYYYNVRHYLISNTDY